MQEKTDIKPSTSTGSGVWGPRSWSGPGASRWLAAGLLLAVVALRVADPWPVEIFRLKIFDYYQTLKPRPVPAEPPVVIIDLDEASLAEVGQWPWSRTTMAVLADRVAKAGGVVLGFDAVFAETDRLALVRAADFPYPMDDAMRRRLDTLPDNDAVFADTIQRTPTVLGQASRSSASAPVAAASIGFRTTFAFKGDGGREVALAYAIPAQSLTRNIPVLEKAAAGRGMISLVTELDNVVRRVPAVFRHGKTFLAALSIEMLRVAVGAPTLIIDAHKDQGIANVIVPKAGRIPTDGHGRIWVHYSRSDPKRYISAKDVLKGGAAARLAGRFVLFGASAEGLRDVRATPVEPAAPGVEIHAQIIESVLTASYLSRPGHFIGAELVLIVVVGGLLIWLVPRVGARWTLSLFLAVAGGTLVTSWILFAQYRMMLDGAYAAVTLLLVYTLLAYMGYTHEESQRRQIRNAFGHYMSPALVEQLANDPGRLRLGGETRNMTLLFCDIRGFTSMSERFDAQGLTRLINQFLTPMTEVIMDSAGTIDKYMGDCIMAFWNAPLEDEQHAEHACGAALDMIRALNDLNAKVEQQVAVEGGTYVPIKVGVGLNTGDVCVGNMGSEQRFDYSVLGDDVNLASRLEGQSKTYGVDIVVGEATRQGAPDRAMLELDVIRVKGKERPVRIFALLGDSALKEDTRFQALDAVHAKMLAAYRAGEWSVAAAHLDDCRVHAKGDGMDLASLYDLYAERIRAFEAEPPGPDWDGVFTAETK